MRKGTGSGVNGLTFLFGDHLGSTSVSYKADGTQTLRQLYAPWGEVITGTLQTDYTFTGQKSHVNQFGLMFYKARWYDPALSRWTQPDTVIPEAAQGVQAWDRLAYVNNSPIRYNDLSGHCLDPDYCPPPQPTQPPPPPPPPQNPSVATEEELNWLETILAAKETPLVMAAIQVIATDGFPLIAGITGGIGPEDLLVGLACFGFSRGAAILGTTSTLYQYHNNLYGTQKTDVAESVTTTIGGFIPFAPIYLTSVHVNLFYTAYRYFGGELPPTFP